MKYNMRWPTENGTMMLDICTTSSIELIKKKISKAASDTNFVGWELAEGGFRFAVDVSDKINFNDFSDEDDYYDVLDELVSDFTDRYELSPIYGNTQLPDISTLH